MNIKMSVPSFGFKLLVSNIIYIVPSAFVHFAIGVYLCCLHQVGTTNVRKKQSKNHLKDKEASYLEKEKEISYHEKDKLDTDPRKHSLRQKLILPCETLHWLVCFLYIFLHTVALIEGLLTVLDRFDHHPPSFEPCHLAYIFASVITISGTILLLFGYALIDENPHYVKAIWIAVAYWTLSGLAFGVRITLLGFRVGNSLQFTLLCLSLVVCMGMLVLDVYTLVKITRDGLRVESLPFGVKLVHDVSSFLSRCSFHWMSGLFLHGYKHPIQMVDLGVNLPQGDTTQDAVKELKTIVEDEMHRSSHATRRLSLWRCLWLASLSNLIPTAGCKLLADCSLLVAPLCLNNIVNYVVWYTIHPYDHGNRTSQGITVVLDNEMQSSNTSQSVNEAVLLLPASHFLRNGFLLSVVCAVASIVYGFSFQAYEFQVKRHGVRMKAAIQGLVYDKTLRLAPVSLTEGTSGSASMSQGSVVNHMSVDAAHIYFFCYWAHCIWSNPLQVIVITYLLYNQLGYSALLGCLVIYLSCPLQYMIGRRLGHVQKHAMELADERLRRSTELLTSIKLLKLYAWEQIFCERVLATRRKELWMLLKAALLRVVCIMFTDGAPVIACIVTFTTHPFLDSASLSPGKVFSGLTLFSLVALPLYLVPTVVSVIAHANVSVNRLAAFLEAPEVTGDDCGPGSEVSTDYDGLVSSNVTQSASPYKKDDQAENIGSDVPEAVQMSASHGDCNIKEKDVFSSPKEEISNNQVGKVTSNEGSNTQEIISNAQHSSEIIQVTKSNNGNEIPTYCANIEPVEEESQALLYENQNLKESSVVISKDVKQFRCTCSGIKDEHSDSNTCENVYEFRDCSFSWDGEGKYEVLKNITFSVKRGELTMIVGPVASGKSSILAAMLGEMTQRVGLRKKCRNVVMASAAQKAWLQNASLQDNILFGSPYDRDLYDRVLDMCALRPDLLMLPALDKTEIGEKGVNLSGGQKQRVSLARAIYSRPDVIILDDPFSALDVHVGQEVFQAAILEHLLSEGVTVVLVTHHIHILQHAHKIIALEDGRVIQEGTLTEIQTQRPHLYETWVSEDVEDADQSIAEDHLSAMAASGSRRASSAHHQDNMELMTVYPSPGLHGRSMSTLSLSQADPFPIEADNRQPCSVTVAASSAGGEAALSAGGEAANGTLIEAEERETGSVSWRVYLSYARAASIVLSAGTILGYSARQGLRMLTDFWLAMWSEASMAITDDGNPVNVTGLKNNTDMLLYDLDYYIAGYAYLSIISLVLLFLGILFLELMCLNASRNLHSSLLHSVVAAPARFFDVTPVGRIVNRLAGDTQILDEKMPVTWDVVLFCSLYVLGGILMNVATNAWFTLAAVPVITAYCVIQRYCLATSRELQRLDNLSKSPVLSHFTETLSGLTTIRAYRCKKRFEEKHWAAVDANNTTMLFLAACNCWMGLRLDLVGALIVFAASLCSLSAGVVGASSPGIVAIAIAYAIMVAQFVNWMMRSATEIEMFFNSVERQTHYANVAPEVDFNNPESHVEPSWPSHGEIELRNVSLRYDASLEPVVSGLNLHIKPATKVGICGRTGSGKSSLTLSLFRLIDVCSGSIWIDGVDTAHIRIHTLRSRLAIIPQDPVLFAASVRFNVDPESQCGDAEIWSALKQAQLDSAIRDLEELVAEGGANYSVGQRQLFCLARAIVKKCRILILDEATASMDRATDAAIQSVIQAAFSHCTVITIAHRVSTILSCDQIVVMQDGSLLEEGSPQQLLRDKQSRFAKMVQADNTS